MVVSSEMLLLCPGDNAVLTCGFNGSVIQWKATHPHNMETGVGTQFITASSTSNMTHIIIVANGVTYRFLRISSSPLVSLLEVYNVNANITGTRIECLDGPGNKTLLTEVINVVENGEFLRLTFFFSLSFRSKLPYVLSWGSLIAFRACGKSHPV